jgi:hypothetical protein
VVFNRIGPASGPVQHLTVWGGPAGANTTYRETILVPDNGRYSRYYITCKAGASEAAVEMILHDGAPPLAPTLIRDQLTAEIVIPRPDIAGSPSLAENISIVRDPTWFWVTNWADTITDSANRNGMQVAVAAEATHVVWNPGDGSRPIICNGPGTEYIPWTGMDPFTDTDCSHTYLRSTAGEPGDALTITATTHWDLTWELDGIDQGTFGTFTSTSTQSHQVGEILVVNN